MASAISPVESPSRCQAITPRCLKGSVDQGLQDPALLLAQFCLSRGMRQSTLVAA